MNTLCEMLSKNKDYHDNVTNISGVVPDVEKNGESEGEVQVAFLMSSAEFAEVEEVRHNLWTRKGLIARTLPNSFLRSLLKNVYLRKKWPLSTPLALPMKQRIENRYQYISFLNIHPFSSTVNSF